MREILTVHPLGESIETGADERLHPLSRHEGTRQPIHERAKTGRTEQGILAKKLKDYRSGEIKTPTMAIMAYNLSDEEIDVLAAYFSQFPTILRTVFVQ